MADVAPTPEPVPASGPARGGVQFIPRPGSWREGRPPPWASVPPDRRHLTLDGIRAALQELSLIHI